jgi:hypothetical protein
MSDALWEIINDCWRRVPCERPVTTSVVMGLQRIVGFVIIACC